MYDILSILFLHLNHHSLFDSRVFFRLHYNLNVLLVVLELLYIFLLELFIFLIYLILFLDHFDYVVDFGLIQDLVHRCISEVSKN